MGSILKLIEELIITTLRVVIFRIDPGRFEKYPPDFGANGTKVVGRKVRNRLERERRKKRGLMRGFIPWECYSRIFNLHGRNVPPLMKFYFRPFVSNSFIYIYIYIGRIESSFSSTFFLNILILSICSSTE